MKKLLKDFDHDVLLQKLYAFGFSKHTVNWFKSYLSNRFFLINLGNNFSQAASVSCDVPPGILGSLLFLIYVKGMLQAAKCHICLYVAYSFLVCQHKAINEIEKQLNVNFSNICDWFVENKLSILFGEDKTKSILFASTFKKENIKKVNMEYGDV